jgi:hypothetical protein
MFGGPEVYVKYVQNGNITILIARRVVFFIFIISCILLPSARYTGFKGQALHFGARHNSYSAYSLTPTHLSRQFFENKLTVKYFNLGLSVLPPPLF